MSKTISAIAICVSIGLFASAGAFAQNASGPADSNKPFRSAQFSGGYSSPGFSHGGVPGHAGSGSPFPNSNRQIDNVDISDIASRNSERILFPLEQRRRIEAALPSAIGQQRLENLVIGLRTLETYVDEKTNADRFPGAFDFGPLLNQVPKLAESYAAPISNGKALVMSGDKYSHLLQRMELTRADDSLTALPMTVEGATVFEIKSDLSFVLVRHSEDVGKTEVPVNYAVTAAAAGLPPARIWMEEKAKALTIARFSFAAAIHTAPPDNAVQCSAVMVAPDLALTAGHCACSPDAQDFRVTLGESLGELNPIHVSEISQWRVLGGMDRCRACSGGICPEGPFFDLPDIALVRLVTKTDGWVSVPPIAGPELLSKAKSVYWVGWGALGEDPVVRNTRKRGGGESVLSPDCETGALPENSCLRSEEAFTFALVAPEGPCRGDSGAAGYITMEDGTPALALISSRQADPPGALEKGCGNGSISALVDAPAVRSFLVENGVNLVRLDKSALTLAEKSSAGGQ